MMVSWLGDGCFCSKTNGNSNTPQTRTPEEAHMLTKGRDKKNKKKEKQPKEKRAVKPIKKPIIKTNIKTSKNTKSKI